MIIHQGEPFFKPYRLPGHHPNLFQGLGKKDSLKFLSHFSLVDPLVGTAPAITVQAATEALKSPITDPGFSYEIVSYSPNKMVIKTKANRSGILYWSDGYNEKWKAKLDNLSVPIFQTNKNFKSVTLPLGEHILSFHFEPLFFEFSLLLYYAVFLVSVSFTWKRKEPNES